MRYLLKPVLSFMIIWASYFTISQAQNTTEGQNSADALAEYNAYQKAIEEEFNLELALQHAKRLLVLNETRLGKDHLENTIALELIAEFMNLRVKSNRLKRSICVH